MVVINITILLPTITIILPWLYIVVDALCSGGIPNATAVPYFTITLQFNYSTIVQLNTTPVQSAIHETIFKPPEMGVEFLKSVKEPCLHHLTTVSQNHPEMWSSRQEKNGS